MKTDGVPVEIIATNTLKKSRHTMPVIIPKDCIDMDLETFKKAYGAQLIQATHDLLQHKAFRKGLEKPKLIIAP